MKQSTKLQPIANIRKQQEENAGRLHGEAIREAEQQQSQLDELMKYRAEYINGFESVGKSGLSAIQAQEYRLFINRLDEAIAQQKLFVENGKSRCEASQQEWLDKRSKSKIINKVVEKRQHAERLQKVMSEQKELEDRPYKKFDGV
jgi:flagellar FliJ protein